jgi:hypothetical protein
MTCITTLRPNALLMIQTCVVRTRTLITDVNIIVPVAMSPLCAESPPKQCIPVATLVVRDVLSLFHINVVIIVYLDLLEILFESGLLRINVVTAEILHPGIVAHQLLLYAVSS